MHLSLLARLGITFGVWTGFSLVVSALFTYWAATEGTIQHTFDAIQSSATEDPEKASSAERFFARVSGNIIRLLPHHRKCAYAVVVFFGMMILPLVFLASLGRTFTTG